MLLEGSGILLRQIESVIEPIKTAGGRDIRQELLDLDDADLNALQFTIQLADVEGLLFLGLDDGKGLVRQHSVLVSGPAQGEEQDRYPDLQTKDLLAG